MRADITVPTAVDIFYACLYLHPHARRRVEQLAARRAHNPEVVGSSPTPAKKTGCPLGIRSFFVGEEDSKGETGRD